MNLLPTVRSLIRRRMLVNFRVAPEVMGRLLPPPLRPKLHAGHAIAGICLIRLEQVRPAGVPGWLGLASENAAHRVAVEWDDPTTGARREGVYIPRRDTDSWLNTVAGGRIFPGTHGRASFSIRDDADAIDLRMASVDGEVAVHVAGRGAEALPTGSCFASLPEASAFFEQGCIGYSTSREAGLLEGLRLETTAWRVRPMAVAEVESSFFSDPRRFPAGSAAFDHALLMRDVPCLWRSEAELRVRAAVSVEP